MSKRITTNCEQCSKQFSFYPSVSPERKYCSRNCADIAKRTRHYIDCRWCGNPFEITPTMYSKGYRLCSWECRVAEKEDQKNRICETCQKPFKVSFPSHQTRTCSNQCAFELRKRGKYQPCIICGKSYWVMPVQFGTSRYCGRKCKAIGVGLFQSGENHPNWHGGTSNLPYPFEWTKELKKSIQSRDGKKCRECGTGKHLSVHHINYDKSNCSETNLITLCVGCNSRANFNRVHWQNRYENMIDAIYSNST